MKSRMRRCLPVMSSIAPPRPFAVVPGTLAPVPGAFKHVFDSVLDSRTCVRHSGGVRRTRVRWGRVGSLVVVLATALTLVGVRAGAAAGKPVSSRPAVVYVVRSGDTLWGIARRHLG